MSVTLALFEAGLIFLVVAARLLVGETAPTPGVLGLAATHALALTLCALFAFHFNDFYDLHQVRGFGPFIRRLPRALLMAFVLGGLVEWSVPGFRTSLSALGGTVLILGAVVLPLRALLHHLSAARPFSRRVLVLGTTALAGKLVREILIEPDMRDVVVGVADDGSGEFTPALPSLRLGTMENLGQIIEGFQPDLIVCASAARHDPLLMRELLKPQSRGIPVEDGVSAYERITGKIAIEFATPRAILFTRQSEVTWLAFFLARVLSVTVACIGIVLFAPLLLPVALLIKLDSDGPVFFLHQRVGLGGRPFNLVKFRTLSTGVASSEWAADNIHRTTRVGHWLRRFRIDEIPQFLNILRGDMNLVGPRPHPLSNIALFTEHIPYYAVRCSVRPGVTGWAQIRYGYANNLEEETEKMRYDLHYIRNLSLGLDLRILLETVKVVVTGGRPATLAEEPGPRVLPIYFGIEHARRPARPGASASDADGVVSIEAQRAKGPRVSRDVAWGRSKP